MGSTVCFDGETYAGGVFGAGDVDIDEACDGNVGGFVSFSRSEILFNIACSGLRHIRAASEESGVNERTSYLSSRRSCVNVGRMDLVVIHYRIVIVGLPDDDAWRMPVLDSNACLGVMLLGIIGWARSAIMTAGAVEQKNRGKDEAALEIHLLLPQRIRSITYRCW